MHVSSASVSSLKIWVWVSLLVLAQLFLKLRVGPLRSSDFIILDAPHIRCTYILHFVPSNFNPVKIYQG